jgi:peptidoglycan/LPS O-acetylase OafA/YrhL
MATRQIVGLDAIRFLAAGLVMTYHYGFWIWAAKDPAAQDRLPFAYAWLAPYLSSGWVGVEIFFVISGYVIVYTTAGATPFTFFRSRFLRIFPAVWICATVTAAVLLIGGAGHAPVFKLGEAWVKSVILYPYYGWVDGAYWTLGIEISFYAFVLGVIACRRTESLFRAIGVLGLLSSVFWIACFASDDVLGTERIANAVSNRSTDLLLLRYAGFFALGAFLCLARSRRLSAAERGCCAVFIIGGMIEIRDMAIGLSGLSTVPMPATVPIFIWLGFVAAIGLSARWNAAFVRLGPGFVRTMRAIGLMTFPLYLLHQSIGYVVIDAWRRDLGDTGAMCAAMTLCLGLAWIVSRYLEPAFRSNIGAWLERARGRTAAAGASFTTRAWSGRAARAGRRQVVAQSHVATAGVQGAAQRRRAGNA